ncbi:hypothetical protein [Planomonospora venezuelensis]|uniref:Uncharacterized protein n=1 Tax=Planomonospora venezuelensis TaxID=1999 RepID=A0A841CUD0_PLAVE|nr:hypothetical protein [Planomonospora venezuelensis]MBB5960940.1 hypothetical protein [Planomonospora venezuelensis]GIN01174.1 hypothetical protein Pve01_28320 [Planomonospora venezuelensis]
MDFVGFSAFTVVLWAFGILVQFFVIYFAVRMALKHDRERSGPRGPQF